MSHHTSAAGCHEYARLSRRGFLGASSATLLAAAAAPAWLPRVARAASFNSAQRDVIISLYLRGGADGLTFVPPVGEDAYYAARPTIAVARPDDAAAAMRAIDLDGFFGLAPQLAPLMPAWNDGKLLICQAVGTVDTSRSHFDAQKFMEIGDYGNPGAFTGWLGRHLASIDPARPDALLRGIGFSSGLQRTLAGGPRSLPIPNPASFGLSGSTTSLAARTSAIADMHAAAAEPLRTVADNTLDTIDLLRTINFAGYTTAGSVAYPTGSLGTALKSTAALVKAQVGVEAVAIDYGGWDTHSAQGNNSPTGVMNNLLATLGAALAAFYSDMTTGVAPTFTLVLMSEFGRRFRENGSQGVDHGHGNMMMVLGNCVRGGRVLSAWPGLAPNQLFQGLDLAVTMDYRDILAKVVAARLGNANLGYVFPNYTPVDRDIFSC